MHINEQKNVDVCHGIEFGSLLNIQVDGLGSSKSSIIGIERGRYLIIKTPAIAGISTKLFKKNHFVVRYLCDGILFGFHCTLIALLKDPFQLSFLSYPETGDTINLRKHDRMSCLLPGELQLSEWKRKCVISDISTGGCRIALNLSMDDNMNQFKVGELVQLVIQAHDINDAISVTAGTRSISLDEKNVIIGLQFEKPINQKIDMNALDKIKKVCLLLKAF
jgi:hypothetical protein